MHTPDRYELNAGWSLPGAYGVDRLVLLPRDPHCLFAYWEITPRLISAMREQYPHTWEQGRTVLRIYDLETLSYRDTLIHGPADNWYVAGVDADKTYRAELGQILPDGTFAAMAASNNATTPRDTISSVTDPRWKMFAFWQTRYYRRMPVGISSYEMFLENERTPEGGLRQ